MHGAAREALLPALLLPGTLLVSRAAAAASYPPQYRFRTVSTDRVSVHFHQGFEPMARQAAAMATEILAGHEARYGRRVGRVQVVLVDADDDPNGFASPLPYPLVTIRAVAPKGHHFNRDAPNELTGLGEAESYKPKTFGGREISFSVPGEVAFTKGTKYLAKLYVCDDGDKYCVPQKLADREIPTTSCTRGNCGRSSPTGRSCTPSKVSRRIPSGRSPNSSAVSRPRLDGGTSP